jgi:hypothetical protein
LKMQDKSWPPLYKINWARTAGEADMKMFRTLFTSGKTPALVGASGAYLIGSADLHTGSALIRYIPSHPIRVSYTQADRPDSQ